MFNCEMDMFIFTVSYVVNYSIVVCFQYMSQIFLINLRSDAYETRYLANTRHYYIALQIGRTLSGNMYTVNIA